MWVDILETSIYSGGGKRWDDQMVELHVSMLLWKLWPAKIYRKKKQDRYGVQLKEKGKGGERREVRTPLSGSCWCFPAEWTYSTIDIMRLDV